MADNTTLNPGSGGDVIASDDIAGVKYQRVKLSLGADGTAADAPIGGGVQSGALRVTLASDSTGTIATVGAVTALTNALPAGTNNIGDVDVLSVVPGTGATSLGKAEDAAHSSGDTGVMALAVRRDADTALVATDGDYAPLQVNANGALKVAVAAGGIAGVVEDAAASGGEEGIMVLAVRRDTAASSSGTDGDFSTLNTDASGRLHTIAAIASGQTLATVTNVATIGTSVTPGTGAAHLGKAEDAAHASGDTGVMMLSVRANTAAATSGSDGDYQPLITDTNGRLHVIEPSAANALTSLQLIDDAIVADDATFTPATTKVQMAGFTADETATDSVDEGDGGAARMTLDRKQIVTQYVHPAAGGHSPYKNLDVDETEDDIKTSPGKLFWLHAMNLTTGVLYLKIYNNVAASVTVGTTVPDLTFPIPTMGDTNGAGFCIHFGDSGMQFSTGICIAATTGLADNNTGAPTANALVVNAGFA